MCSAGELWMLLSRPVMLHIHYRFLPHLMYRKHLWEFYTQLHIQDGSWRLFTHFPSLNHTNQHYDSPSRINLAEIKLGRFILLLNIPHSLSPSLSLSLIQYIIRFIVCEELISWLSAELRKVSQVTATP